MSEGAAAIQARLSEQRPPMLIMPGTGDTIVDFDTQSATPNAQDAGHMVHHIAPIAVPDAIRQLVPQALMA